MSADSPDVSPDDSPDLPLDGAPEIVHAIRTPRAGELTLGWRLVTAVTWILVVIALGAVWNTSEQLGLSTWWLGPRGLPNPLPIRLLPFVAPVLMVVVAANHVRHTPWLGLGASGLVVLTGVFDLGRVTGLGMVEILIGLAAAAVSAASLTGTYRTQPVEAEPPVPVEVGNG